MRWPSSSTRPTRQRTDHRPVSDIFTGRITNWQEVGGNDAPIILVRAETNSGTHVYFLEEVVRKGDNTDILRRKHCSCPSSVRHHQRGAAQSQRHRLRRPGLHRPGAKAHCRCHGCGVARFVVPSVATGSDGSYPSLALSICTRPASRRAPSPIISPGCAGRRAEDHGGLGFVPLPSE